MRNKKAQLTVFIILGVVIVIIVGFVLFSSRYTQQKKSETEIRKSRQATFDLTPIQTHIKGCIKKVTEDGLTYITKQGGYIFGSQGGTLMDFSPSNEGLFFVKDGDDIVPYAIYPPQFIEPHPATYFSTPPYYPSVCFPYEISGLTCNTSQEDNSGFFGSNNLKPLDGQEHSIRSQLTKYMEDNIMNCIDFSIFEMQGFEVLAGEMLVDVTLARRNVVTSLTLPLEITKVVTDETTNLEEFSSIVDVRMSDLHNFVNNLIEQDITDVNFNIDHSQNDVDGFSVSVQEVNNNQGDDIVTVTDSLSRIKGQEVKFRFARHNRAPALHYIPQCLTPPCTFASTNDVSEDDFVDQTDAIPDASDPDGDGTTISFELVTYGTPPKDYARIKAFDGFLEDFQDVEIIIQP
jgi:hypothetical protein